MKALFQSNPQVPQVPAEHSSVLNLATVTSVAVVTPGHLGSPPYGGFTKTGAPEMSKDPKSHPNFGNHDIGIKVPRAKGCNGMQNPKRGKMGTRQLPSHYGSVNQDGKGLPSGLDLARL